MDPNNSNNSDNNHGDGSNSNNNGGRGRGRKRTFQQSKTTATTGQKPESSTTTTRASAAAAAIASYADSQPSTSKQHRGHQQQQQQQQKQDQQQQQQRQQQCSSVIGSKKTKKGLILNMNEERRRSSSSSAMGGDASAAAAATKRPDDDDESTTGLKRPKRPVEHLVEMLGNREVYGGYRKYRRCPRARAPGPRRFYQAIYPNVTIVNVETPHCFLRKFSPDGKIMIAFGPQQQSIQIYGYNGVASCGELMNSRSAVLMQHDDTFVGSSDIRKDLFQTLFKHKFTIPVTGENGNMNIQLNRECALFTSDNRFLILAGSGHAFQEEHGVGLFRDISQTYESLEPTHELGLETVYVYCMDLQEGIEADCKIFKADRIFLSQNQGLYLIGHLLAVLSVMHQTIYLFTIDRSTGKLVPVQTIGYFLYDDDEMFLQHCYRSTNSRQISSPHILGGLKQRIITFLYKLAISRTDEPKWTSLIRFYRSWDKLASLKMRKMQLLDVNTFLILFLPEEFITTRTEPALPQLTLYVVYDWKTTQVKAVFHGLSEELKYLFESNADTFRHPDHEGLPSCSLSNSQAARECHEQYRDTILNAKMGGPNEVIRRLLSQLPIPAQLFSLTPYMDLELFSYDDKLVSPIERPKHSGDTPIRFYSRMSGRMRFQLHTGNGRLQLGGGGSTFTRFHHQHHQQGPNSNNIDDDDPNIIPDQPPLNRPAAGINNNTNNGGGNNGNNHTLLRRNGDGGETSRGNGNVGNRMVTDDNGEQLPSTSNPAAAANSGGGGLMMANSGGNGGASSSSSGLSGKNSLVHFIFHPTEPLAISIQRRIIPAPRNAFDPPGGSINSRYIVNFHLRAESDRFISGQ